MGEEEGGESAAGESGGAPDGGRGCCPMVRRRFEVLGGRGGARRRRLFDRWSTGLFPGRYGCRASWTPWDGTEVRAYKSAENLQSAVPLGDGDREFGLSWTGNAPPVLNLKNKIPSSCISSSGLHGTTWRSDSEEGRTDKSLRGTRLLSLPTRSSWTRKRVYIVNNEVENRKGGYGGS